MALFMPYHSLNFILKLSTQKLLSLKPILFLFINKNFIIDHDSLCTWLLRNSKFGMCYSPFSGSDLKNHKVCSKWKQKLTFITRMAK